MYLFSWTPLRRYEGKMLQPFTIHSPAQYAHSRLRKKSYTLVSATGRASGRSPGGHRAVMSGRSPHRAVTWKWLT